MTNRKKLIIQISLWAAYLYVMGLIIQAITNRTHQIIGQEMKVVDPNPITAFGAAINPTSGLIFTVIGFAIIMIFADVIKKNAKFTIKDNDKRKLSRSERGTYGTAGYMTEEKIESIFERKNTFAECNGITLGKRANKIFCLPADGSGKYNRNMAVFGAPGSGKSECLAKPYTFGAVKRGESLIFTDPKGELYGDLSNYL